MDLILRLARVALAVPLVLGAATASQAQLLDHYNSYVFQERTPVPVPPFVLIDQWGASKHVTAAYDRFLVPTTQDEDPIGDPDLFYTQYFIDFGPEPDRAISVSNKFGEDQMWAIHQSFALLNPSLKQQPGGDPPVANHYKCYVADGPFIGRTAILTDQFGSYTVVVTEPAYWCNPTVKEIDGIVYEIVDENAWLGCYFTDPITPLEPPIPVTITDQFGVTEQFLVLRDILCVPSLKATPVPTETVSWGQLKATYR